MEQQPELLGVPKGEKHCAVCGEVKPATAFYFDKDSHSDDGWNPKCKDCRREYRQKEENKKIAAVVQQAQIDLLAKIANGEGREPLCDVVSGSEVILEAFGGIQGLAQHLVETFESCKPGTPGKVKVLQSVLQFVSKGMEKQQSVELGNLSDAELELEWQKRIGTNDRRLTSEPQNPTALGDAE